MKTTEELAHRLIDFCNQLEFLKAYEALYAPEAESIDPFNKINPHLVGLDNLIENEKKFLQQIEKINQVEVGGLVVSGRYFSTRFYMHFDIKNIGNIVIDELCVYEVQNDKIVKQQFFVN